jgi:predicted enzyme involved in methoxymalonyl-ACP biosynthesis
MGRGIGGAILIAIINYAKEKDAKTIKGILREIESNWRMKPLYTKRGFEVIKKEGNETTYRYTIKNELPSYHSWLNVERKGVT